MQLKDKDILKFQTIYKSKFGIEISREDAYEKGIKLLRLMSFVYKPITMDEYQQLQKRSQEAGWS